MNNNLNIFDYGQNQIRTMMIDENPWFVGKDIAETLGYKIPKDAIFAHVDIEDKNMIQLSDIQEGGKTPPPHAKDSKIMIINESGMYSLIFSSKLDSAKKFKRWVTSEVLPTIRKTGSYAMQVNDEVQHTYQALVSALREDNSYLRSENERIALIYKDLKAQYTQDNKTMEELEFDFYNHNVKLHRENSNLKCLLDSYQAKIRMAISREKLQQLDTVTTQKEAICEQRTQIAQLKTQCLTGEEENRAAVKQIKKLTKKNRKLEAQCNELKGGQLIPSSINKKNTIPPHLAINSQSPSDIMRQGLKVSEELNVALRHDSTPLLYCFRDHWVRMIMRHNENNENELWISGVDLKYAFGHFLWKGVAVSQSMQTLKTNYEWLSNCESLMLKNLPRRFLMTWYNHRFFEWKSIGKRVDKVYDYPKDRKQRDELEDIMMWPNSDYHHIETDHKKLQAHRNKNL